MELKNVEEQVRKLMIEVIENLNYDPNDLELQKYLYEKGTKAFHKINSGNYSLDEIKNFIVTNVPKMMEEYLRMKQVITKKSLTNTNFGVSMNYQLIGLFKLLNDVSSVDEFDMMKNRYLKSQPTIFPGLLECTYEEIQNIYHNMIDNCDVITPEAEAKMTLTINDQMEPFNSDGTVNSQVFNFSYLDTIVAFAKQNNMKVRLHTLIWHKHFPKILDNCSKNQIITFLDTYFSDIANRYDADTFYTIDVLNEIVADIHSEEFKQGIILRNSKWKQKLGDDYYLTVLKLARKNFPHSNLAYNEYDETNQEKRKRMISIINDIKQEEAITGTILLDSIGLQSHYHEYTTDEEIKEAYADLSHTRKRLQVSEMDVTKIDNQDDVQVNRVFRTVLDCSATYNIDSFTCWGSTSSISWKSKKVKTFLNDNGDIDNSCKQVVDTYSQKKKNKNLNFQKSNLQNNSLTSNLSEQNNDFNNINSIPKKI